MLLTCFSSYPSILKLLWRIGSILFKSSYKNKKLSVSLPVYYNYVVLLTESSKDS